MVYIAVIDYGVGNLMSVTNALQYIGRESKITDQASDLERADGIILPGVGAFPDAAEKLQQTGLVATLKEQAAKKPMLGICLGLALKQALGDRAGIRRFGSCYVPMDEALTFTALDFSNRPYLVFDAPMPQERIGEYDSCLTVEFMRALAMNAGITLHQKCFYGANAHHITEGLFKSLGMAVRDAVKVEGSGVVSTKGVL